MTMRTISPVPLEEQYSCLLLLYHILCSLARRVRANCQHMLHPRINAALPSSSYDPLTTDNSPKILLCPIPYSSSPATYPLSALSHLVGDTRSHQRCSFLIPPMLLTSRLSTLVRRCAFCPIQCSNDRKKNPSHTQKVYDRIFGVVDDSFQSQQTHQPQRYSPYEMQFSSAHMWI